MKRNHYVLVGLTAVVLMWVVFVDTKSTNTALEKKNEAAPVVQEDSVHTVAASPKKELFTIAPDELKTMRDSLPLVEDVREEVKTDPHRTPPSLMNFAKSMSPLMEKALKDEHDADILMNALRDCALDESGAQAARVLCVTNSERLAERHHRLKEKADNLRTSVDSEVKKILRSQDAFKK